MEYTQEELKTAFELVENKKDWKASIDSTIKEKDIEIVKAAIIHFTGTVPKIWFCGECSGIKFYDVKAVGYRNGPCGP